MLRVEATKDTQKSQPVDFFKYLVEQQQPMLFVRYMIQMEELCQGYRIEGGGLCILKAFTKYTLLSVLREEAATGSTTQNSTPYT